MPEPQHRSMTIFTGSASFPSIVKTPPIKAPPHPAASQSAIEAKSQHQVDAYFKKTKRWCPQLSTWDVPYGTAFGFQTLTCEIGVPCIGTSCPRALSMYITLALGPKV